MALTRINNQALTNVTSAGLPSGTVLQVKQAISNSRVTTSSTSFVDTGLFTGVTFDNALQPNSKVLVQLQVAFGETDNGSWARTTDITIYEGSTNIGDNNNDALISGHAAHPGNSTATRYQIHQAFGSILYTPSSTNPSYKVYWKCNSAFTRTLGGMQSAEQTDYSMGGTRLTLMEIAG